MVAAITFVEVTPFSCSICLCNYTLWSLDVHNSACNCMTRTITITLCCFFFILQNCWHHHHSFSSRFAEIKSNWINYATTVVCRCNLDAYFLSEWTPYLLLLCSELYQVRFCAYINYGKRTTAVFFASMHRIVLGEILCLEYYVLHHIAIDFSERTTAVFWWLCISVLFLNSLSSPETCITLFVGEPKSCHMTGAFNKHRNYADAIMIIVDTAIFASTRLYILPYVK